MLTISPAWWHLNGTRWLTRFPILPFSIEHVEATSPLTRIPGSLSQDSSPSQCRWKWCSKTCLSVPELLEHVREHVRQAEPCYIRDIALNIRAEEGLGDSLSGMGYSRSLSQSHDPALNNSSAVMEDVPLPAMQHPRLASTPERAAKRRKISPLTIVPSFSLPRSRETSVSPPPPGINRTPSFATLALSQNSAERLTNPNLPDLNTLISETLAPRTRDTDPFRLAPPARDPFSTPNRSLSQENPGSQSFSGSDRSVERQLTQDLDSSFVTNSPDAIIPNGLDGSQNLYAGELQWDDDQSQRLPRFHSPTPINSSESQSQSEPQSIPVDTSPRLPNQTPSPRRQSWYQSPRRVSHPKKTPPGGPQTPLDLSPQNAPDTPQAKISTPRNGYLSGSLKIQSPFDAHSRPYGDALDPSVISQPQSPSSFIPQTQAPYRYESMSQ
ncbi:hypothetical protein B0H16DRAFT_606669 [Mycena metata]|uniref:C2H2-type domain-containing protein n=1 Tax=Mycena metata TaxID=1033252 RepID=A0AAD7KBD2_9AGAR|nr:hypothetical protein B0H16DRAFT_606669 [Mycena metata]